METNLPSEPPSRVSTTTTRQPTKTGGEVTQTIELIDTGERKEMFGMTARHIKTIMTTQPSPDACQKGGQKIETDGWYVDLSYGRSCQMDRPMTTQMSPGDGGCRDKINVFRKGRAKLGYPLMQTTTIGMSGPDGGGDRTTTMTIEVVELSRSTLPQELFDVPTGYTEAASRQELYAGASQRAISDYAKSQTSQTAPTTTRMPDSANTKKPGTIRVGVLPVTNATARPLTLEMHRNSLIAGIIGGTVEAVAITSESDAARLNCDYILSTNVKSFKQSNASKIGGMFGKATGASTGGLAKVESVVGYNLRKLSGGPGLTADATAKVEGDDASVVASLGSAAEAVKSYIAKNR